jgi:hypothetical protein
VVTLGSLNVGRSGWVTAALAGALATGVDGCGGVVAGTSEPSPEAGGPVMVPMSAGGSRGTVNAPPSGLAGASCPAVAPPEPEVRCDVFQTVPGDCPPAQTCRRKVSWGADACAPPHWVASCEATGSGSQGAACTASEQCASKFECLHGQCRKLCKAGAVGACPDGLICEDVEGLGDEGTCG